MGVTVNEENEDLKFPIDTEGRPYILFVLNGSDEDGYMAATVEYDNLNTPEIFEQVRYGLMQIASAL